MGRKVAVIAGLGDSLINFRGPLLSLMIERGHDVVTLAAAEDELAGSVQGDLTSALEKLGVRHFPIPMSRTGTSPRQDYATYQAIRKLLITERVEVVLAYTAKAVIYGCMAGGNRRCETHALITGLSYGLRNEEELRSPKSRLVQMLYRRALSRNSSVIFQNPDDRDLFRRLNLFPDAVQSPIVNGSGVRLDHFTPSDPVQNPLTFTMVARLLAEKGVREFAEAARIVKAQAPEVKFVLVGPLDNHPTAIQRQEVDSWVEQGIVSYAGPTQDVRPFLRDTSVYVLPSYREGTPRSVLEAMAVGRAILTTDAPGCRETTIEGVNGYLVPTKDANALAEAMMKFVLRPELVPTMGEASLNLALEKYDVNKVNRAMLETMKL